MRYMTKSASFVLFVKEHQVLLQKRQNTGYMDGFWDLGVSGHVEEGETARGAALRETLEEVGVVLSPERFDLATVIHNVHNGEVYYNFYFVVRVLEEEVRLFRLNEPHKIEMLQWFDVAALPTKMSAYNRAAIHHYLAGIPYGEMGWEM
ncbi:NUDIX domain-containing protein [Aerococcaceae bacterium NML180378]|nr:NUDIX domain-containing protein [Aerococcaceae bacterium NML180378]